MDGDGARPPDDLIESVDHALRVLSMLETQSELRVSLVADELGVARSTAHRLLSTLAWRGFVNQDRVSKVYRAGSALIELGLRSVSEYDLRRVAMPHMERLSHDLGETVNLLILEAGACRFIGGVQSANAVKTRLLTGTVLPAYATSGGKVLLASLPPEDLRALYPRGLKKVTGGTHRTLAGLRDELALIRNSGYAVNNEESAVGLRAVAVPVRDRIGRCIAALAVSAPTSRLNRAQVPRAARLLQDFATLIRNDLP
jgi:DNA-binding IclR family transcriptional regulator